MTAARERAVRVVAEAAEPLILESLDAMYHFQTTGSSERMVQAIRLREEVAEAVVAALEADEESVREQIATEIEARLKSYQGLGKNAVANRYTVMAAFDTAAQIARQG